LGGAVFLPGRQRLHPYLTRLTDYIQDSARGTVFTEAYLELTAAI
jgi:hypothetical protein